MVEMVVVEWDAVALLGFGLGSCFHKGRQAAATDSVRSTDLVGSPAPRSSFSFSALPSKLPSPFLGLQASSHECSALVLGSGCSMVLCRGVYRVLTGSTNPTNSLLAE